jgi:hypothetical protein
MSIIAKMAAVGGRGRLLLALGVGCAAVLTGMPAASAGTPMLTFYWNTDGSSIWPSQSLGVQCAGDPAMARTPEYTEITCQIAGNALGFIWAKNGTNIWHTELVSYERAAYSDPAITTNSAGTEITAQGPNNSLWFWWALNGFTAWHGEQVAGPGTTFSTTFGFFGAGPAITDSGGAVQIAAQGPMNSLWFYEAPYGSMIWHAQQVAGNGSVAGSPAMVLSPTSIEIAAVNNAFSTLGFWSAPRGSYTFGFEQVPAQPLTPNPAMVRFATGTEIAANSDGCIGVYVNTDGSPNWTNPAACLPAPQPELNSPAMVRSRVGTEIADTLLNNSLQFFTNTDGSSNWTSVQIVAANVDSAPAMVRAPAGTEIAVMVG